MTKEKKVIINTKIAKLFGWHSFWMDSVNEHGRTRHMGLHGMTNYPMEIKDYCGSAIGFNNLLDNLYCNNLFIDLTYGRGVPGASARIVITEFPKSYRGYSDSSLHEALAQAVVKMIEDESNKEYLASWK